MFGANGLPVTISGTATATETPVAIPSPWRKGYPNSNGTAPTPKIRAVNFGSLRVSNNDATNNLRLRLNKSPSQITLSPGEIFELKKALVYDISVQSSAATVAFDIVGRAA